MPPRLKMFEESQHQRRIELLQLNRSRRAAQPLAGELKEELKGISIGIAGMGTGLSFVGQPLTQVGSDVRGNESHGCPPSK